MYIGPWQELRLAKFLKQQSERYESSQSILPSIHSHQHVSRSTSYNNRQQNKSKSNSRNNDNNDSYKTRQRRRRRGRRRRKEEQLRKSRHNTKKSNVQHERVAQMRHLYGLDQNHNQIQKSISTPSPSSSSSSCYDNEENIIKTATNNDFEQNLSHLLSSIAPKNMIWEEHSKSIYNHNINNYELDKKIRKASQSHKSNHHSKTNYQQNMERLQLLDDNEPIIVPYRISSYDKSKKIPNLPRVVKRRNYVQNSKKNYSSKTNNNNHNDYNINNNVNDYNRRSDSNLQKSYKDDDINNRRSEDINLNRVKRNIHSSKYSKPPRSLPKVHVIPDLHIRPRESYDFEASSLLDDEVDDLLEWTKTL